MWLALTLALAAQQAPDGWTCADEAFADGSCDCGCGVVDDDCASSGFAACEVDNCAADESPWEHFNESCMASACGDGWRKGDEACDDREAGCAADCSAPLDGFTCGAGASGCSEAGEGEGEGEREEGEEGEGEGEGDEDAGGCASASGAGAGALLLLRRRRRVR